MAFEGNQRVPSEDFRYPGDEESGTPATLPASVLIRLVEFLIDAKGPQQVWRRAELVAFVFRASGAAENKRELAKRLGVSEQRVGVAVEYVREKMPGLLAD